ncbi:MAG: efflux RND transporter periplasmic adaptor subunit [Desulfobacterales bacterium]|nr:efflux RND transporter periplasmic adaptor subunit [Desulfobacterales bacterium]MCP4159660.1 efflux RND transporter periplasmic adaptor subunit [Deltaproteobacteria bacterium]
MDLLKKANVKITLSVSIILIIIIFSLASVFNGAKADEKKDIKPVRPVKSIVVIKNNGFGARAFPALVKVAKEVDLAFRVGGPIKEFNVTIGQKIKKGETIAKVDSRDFEIQISRLKAAIEGAEASLRAMKKGAREEDIASLMANLEASKARLYRSKKQLKRSNKLIEKSFITQASFDQVIEQYKLAKSAFKASTQNLKKAKKGAREEDIQVAEAKIKELHASLSAAKNAYEDTRLKAPFDGIVNKKYMESYENIAPGKPVVSLLDFSTVEIKTSIPEEIMLKRKSFGKIYSIIDAYPNIKIDSKVTEIGQKTSNNNQSFPLTASLAVPKNMDINPGMTATLYIEYSLSDKLEEGYLLPVTAMFSDLKGNSCAWKVNQDMTISQLTLKTGPIKDNNIIIVAGLSHGDRIVTAGARFLMDGQIVRLMEQ